MLRGGAFALKGQAATIAEARALGAVFALSSVMAPFFLGTAAGAIAAGEVPLGNAAGDAWDSWTGALPLMVGVLAVATGAHLAAVFLGADSKRAGRDDLVRAFRARALGSGVVTGALAIAGLAVVKADAPDLYDDLTSGAGLACVIGSGRRGARHPAGSSGASASSSRATPPRPRSARSWPGGRSRRSPTCSRRT